MKLTNEIVDARLVGRPIQRLGDFITSKVKIRWQCLVHKCGYVWESTPSNILFGNRGCPKCANLLPLNNDIVDARLEGRNIKRLSDYINADVKMRWQCTIDGYIWEAPAYSIFGGYGCSKCANNVPLTNDDVDMRLIGRNIKRLGDYMGSRSKIQWQCLVEGCGCIWDAAAGSVLGGGGCPKCAIRSPISNETVDIRLMGRKIKRLDDYVSTRHQMRWQCLVDGCGHIWKVCANHVFDGQGCPRCASSSGEKLIFAFLDEHKIAYTHQMRFDECKNKRPLPFDFYIPQNNLLIEYQGKQHYAPAFIFGASMEAAQSKLEVIQMRDAIKKAWATANGYQLIYFTYKQTAEEIEQVLKSVFLDSKIDCPLTLENKC